MLLLGAAAGTVIAGGCASSAEPVTDVSAIGGELEPSVMGVMGSAPLVLHPIAKLPPGPGNEVSGIVRSHRDPSVFWTLNDSGDEPRVYPIRVDGTLVRSERYPETPGTLIGGAINCDWEDVALDASGRLIIADLGNNTNARADLSIYFVEEPEPTEGRASTTSKILVRYPEQKGRPAPRDDFNYDAEAVFTVGDELFILTKHRSDTFTAMYRVDRRELGVVNDLTLLDRFDVGGKVTGADASPDGLKLAVLTYSRIWLFERTTTSESFFAGRVSGRDYRMEHGESDSESICFENDRSLLVADEARGELYRVPLRDVRGEGE